MSGQDDGWRRMKSASCEKMVAVAVLIFSTMMLAACAEEPPAQFDWGMDSQPSVQPFLVARTDPEDVSPHLRPLPTATKNAAMAEAPGPDDVTPQSRPSPMLRATDTETDGHPLADVIPRPRPPSPHATTASPAPTETANGIDDVIPLLRPDPAAETEPSDAPKGAANRDDVIPLLRPDPASETATEEGDDNPVAMDDVMPRPRPVPEATTATDVADASPAKLVPSKAAKADGRFLWPMEVTIIAEFGTNRDGTRNDGINIAAPRNTPIRAAAAGMVNYAAAMKGYGNLVLIRHSDNYFTAYAHAAKLTVKPGEKVSAGQIIGYCGASGDVSSPQLHFEVRRGVQPLDPRSVLEARG